VAKLRVWCKVPVGSTFIRVIKGVRGPTVISIEYNVARVAEKLCANNQLYPCSRFDRLTIPSCDI